MTVRHSLSAPEETAATAEAAEPLPQAEPANRDDHEQDGKHDADEREF